MPRSWGRGANAAGHTGLTGTSLFVRPDGLVVLLLTNQVIRPRSDITDVRLALAAASDVKHLAGVELGRRLETHC